MHGLGVLSSFISAAAFHHRNLASQRASSSPIVMETEPAGLVTVFRCLAKSVGSLSPHLRLASSKIKGLWIARPMQSFKVTEESPVPVNETKGASAMTISGRIRGKFHGRASLHPSYHVAMLRLISTVITIATPKGEPPSWWGRRYGFPTTLLEGCFGLRCMALEGDSFSRPTPDREPRFFARSGIGPSTMSMRVWWLQERPSAFWP
jgi:hypothetical protein